MTETTEAHAAVVEVRGLVKRYGDEGRRRAEGPPSASPSRMYMAMATGLCTRTGSGPVQPGPGP